MVNRARVHRTACASTALAVRLLVELEHLDASGRAKLSGNFILNGKDVTLEGEGNGPLSAAVEAVNRGLDGKVSIREYVEHSIGEGSEVKAASYVEIAYEGPGGNPKWTTWGVAIDHDITASGLKAVLAATRAVEKADEAARAAAAAAGQQ